MRRVNDRANRPINGQPCPTARQRRAGLMLAGRRWGLVQVAANCLLRLFLLPLVDNPTQLLQRGIGLMSTCSRCSRPICSAVTSSATAPAESRFAESAQSSPETCPF